MKKLINQIIKFGAVGFLCFLIDWVIGLVVMKILVAIMGSEVFEAASVIGSILGFAISVIVNYILSMNFVFERKQDMDRKAEFVIFIVLSIIGMGINSLIIWIGVGPIYQNSSFLQETFGYGMMYTGAKVFATAVVMVYNFITRKIFLEEKNPTQA